MFLLVFLFLEIVLVIEGAMWWITDGWFSAWDFIPDRHLPGGGCYVNQYYTTSPCVNSTLPDCATSAS